MNHPDARFEHRESASTLKAVKSEARPLIQDSRLNSIIAFGLVGALVFSALAFGSVEAWAMAVLESIAVVLIGLWITKSIKEREVRVSFPIHLLPVAGLVCWGLIQSISITTGSGVRKSISMDAEVSRVAVISIFSLLMLSLAAANFLAGKQRLRYMATFLAFYGLALAVFGLIQSFTWDGAFYWLRPTRATGFGPFANRDHFAGYMEMLIPFPVALIATRAIKAEQRPLYAFAAVMMVIGAAASLSRGGILSLAVEGVFLAALAYRSRSRARASAITDTAAVVHSVRRALGVVLLIAVCGLIGALGIAWIGTDPIINKAAQTLTDVRNDQANRISRQWIWSDTWDMIKERPLTGVGMGAYETVYPMYSHSNGRMIVAQSHNDYLQIVADCGAVGAILLVVFLVLLYRVMNRALRTEDRQVASVALACSAGVIGILVHSLVDFNLQVPSNALLFLFLTAMLSNVPATRSQRLRVAVSHAAKQQPPVPIVAGV